MAWPPTEEVLRKRYLAPGSFAQGRAELGFVVEPGAVVAALPAPAKAGSEAAGQRGTGQPHQAPAATPRPRPLPNAGSPRVLMVCGTDLLATFGDAGPDGAAVWDPADLELIMSGAGVVAVERDDKVDISAVVRCAWALPG